MGARASSADATDRLPHTLLRDRMLDMINDCAKSHRVTRMKFKLEAAQTAQELWALRGDLYDLLATEFTQQEATRRINILTPNFQGLVSDSQLKPMR